MTSLSPGGLPLGFQEWLPAAQAATLGLLTFVQEDVPTVGAALLSAAGRLGWLTGFLGCFLGIWIGDALLYLLARGIGRPMLEHPWGRRMVDPRAIARSETWFQQRGTWLLLGSRFVPGTRLPTYLAAGFLRVPFGRFLLATGTAVAVWTMGIFLLANKFGPNALLWLQRWTAGGWALALLAVLSAFAIRLLLRCWTRDFRRRAGAALGRLTRWEFWPAWLFYFPVALNYLRLAIRYGGFTVPTAANPGIFSGGFVGESKIATLRDLQSTSPEFTADAGLIAAGTPALRQAALEELRQQLGLRFPFILKPDVGQRGVGVKLIVSPEQATAYLHCTTAPLVIQRYAPGPHEVGIFYHRLPDESRGRIFAITRKIFPSVTGDGRQTVEELVWRDPRSRFVADKYLDRIGARRGEILAAGQNLRLVEAGNHAQGCIFEDGGNLWSPDLEKRIDEISRRVPGFFVGRYDIRYESEADLRSGRAFQIIELNGAASEATSIYDARNSLLSAYRTLFRQWEIVFAIGAANRRRGCQPTKPSLLWRSWRESVALAATYPAAD